MSVAACITIVGRSVSPKLNEQPSQRSFCEARKAFASRMAMGVSVGDYKWVPPNDGVFRVDVDVGFDKSINRFDIGVVIRDAQRRLIAALSKPFRGLRSVLGGNLAVPHGLTLCIKVDIAHVVIYTDLILAVKVISDPSNSSSMSDDELHEIRELVSKGFVLGFYHMYRSANSVAHELACFAKSCCNVEFS